MFQWCNETRKRKRNSCYSAFTYVEVILSCLIVMMICIPVVTIVAKAKNNIALSNERWKATIQAKNLLIYVGWKVRNDLIDWDESSDFWTLVGEDKITFDGDRFSYTLDFYTLDGTQIVEHIHRSSDGTPAFIPPTFTATDDSIFRWEQNNVGGVQIAIGTHFLVQEGMDFCTIEEGEIQIDCTDTVIANNIRLIDDGWIKENKVVLRSDVDQLIVVYIDTDQWMAHMMENIQLEGEGQLVIQQVNKKRRHCLYVCVMNRGQIIKRLGMIL